MEYGLINSCIGLRLESQNTRHTFIKHGSLHESRGASRSALSRPPFCDRCSSKLVQVHVPASSKAVKLDHAGQAPSGSALGAVSYMYCINVTTTRANYR
jgi:hypothetical protein